MVHFNPQLESLHFAYRKSQSSLMLLFDLTCSVNSFAKNSKKVDTPGITQVHTHTPIQNTPAR